MKINKRVQFLLFFLLLLLCFWNIVTDTPKETEKRYNISVVIRGKMDDSWSNLKKGAENAAEDMGVNLRFVAAIEGNTAEEQIELLKAEAEGTDAIVISPVNRVLLKESILELYKAKKPVILMESGISGENSIPIIQCDNEALGQSLAKNVINHGIRNKKILILSGNAMCSSVTDRQKSFMRTMEETENECFLVSTGKFEWQDIYLLLKERKPDVAVALDTKILENLVKANKKYGKEEEETKVSVYGVGCSSTVLQDLENKDIVTIAVEDDFSIGYLGVQEAVKAIEKKETTSNESIRYILTNSELMYNDVNQKLLFPFIK